MKTFSLSSLWVFTSLLLFSAENPSRSTGTVSGEVRDAVTQQPLPGANVIVTGTSLGASTDANGYYVINGLTPGKHVLRATMVGYESALNADVMVHPQRNTRILFALRSSDIELNAVEVTGDYFARPADNPVSVRTLSPEEIRRSPGSAEDIFRVMQSLPGVATAGGKSAQLIVRGGSPDENLTLLDNIEIYNPIHFARTGESMGIISIVNPALLQSVDFLTGGFPAQYGDKMSSVFDMSLKDGNREMFNTDLNLNIAGFGAMVDGPLSQNSSMILSVRRGFFDILTGLMGKPAAPRYYDAVGKVTLDLDANNRIGFVGFYYLDQVDKSGTTKESSAMSKYDYLARDDYGMAFGVNWRSLLTQKMYLMTTASFTGNGWTTHQGTQTNHDLRGEDILENEYTVKSELNIELAQNWSAKAGVMLRGVDSKNESWDPADTTRTGIIIPATTISYLPKTTSKKAVYVQSTGTILSSLTLSGGLRYDDFAMTGDAVVSPRLSLSYRFLPTTALNLAWGKFQQTPMSYQISPDPRNYSLHSSKAIHYVTGIEHRLADDTRLTVEGYYKDLRDIIVGNDSSAVLVNTGSGFARGIEASVQKKFSDGFVGSASYSYSVSRRTDDAVSAEYDFEYDRPHIVNVLAGWELAEGWQIGAKFQYASGNPYTPVAGVVKKGGVYYLVDGPKNSARYPDYHKLDIRVDKQFILDGWAITAYIDLWNVYNRENVMSYSFKADASGNIIKTEKPDFGIMPIAGITAKF